MKNLHSPLTQIRSYLTSLDDFTFNQPHAYARLKLLERSLGLVLLINMAVGPFNDFYPENADLLWMPGAVDLSFVSWKMLQGFRFFLGLLAISLLVGLCSRLLCFIAGLSLMGFCYYFFRFAPLCWNYHNHLILFLFLISTVDFSVKNPSTAQRQWTSFILTTAQFYVAVIYLQAGISKLFFGGMEWIYSGQNIFVNTFISGSPFGKALLLYPSVFTVFAILTIVFEIGFFLIFFRLFSKKFPQRTLSAWMGIAGILFHLGIWAVMKIAFWQLWFLYPALFIFNSFNRSTHAKLSSV